MIDTRSPFGRLRMIWPFGVALTLSGVPVGSMTRHRPWAGAAQVVANRIAASNSIRPNNARIGVSRSIWSAPRLHLRVPFPERLRARSLRDKSDTRMPRPDHGAGSIWRSDRGAQRGQDLGRHVGQRAKDRLAARHIDEGERHAVAPGRVLDEFRIVG